MDIWCDLQKGTRNCSLLVKAFEKNTRFLVIKFLLLIIIFILITVFSQLAFAFKETNDPAFHSSVDIGISSAGEDLFLLLYLEQGFAYKGLKLILSGPLRFLIHDNSPVESSSLRQQDWDEPSDYAKILRSLTFEHYREKSFLNLRIGELNGIGIGHGSTVSQYFNSTDMDHYQGGLLLKFNILGSGIEFMIEDIVFPELFAGRAYITPLSWFLDGDWPKRFELGFITNVDRGISSAPFQNEDLNSLDEKNATLIMGGDVSVRLVEKKRVLITPYIDVLGMDGDIGIHAGFASSFVLSLETNIIFHITSEYRHLGSDYYPALFNPFYELNRRHFSQNSIAPEATNTFAQHLADPNINTPEAHGFMLEPVLNFNEKVKIGIRYDFQSSSRPHWIMLKLDINPNKNFSLSAFYAGQDINGGSDLIGIDALMGLSIHHKIWGPIRGFAEFSRRFRRNENNMPLANEISSGVGLFVVY